jgi:hypothetical protein
MNKYVLITSMKPVFDCFDAPCRAKLRQTCKWCNQYIRRRLDSAGAQLVIRRAWYYYKLHKNLCVSAYFVPIENFKLLISKGRIVDNNCNKVQGISRAIMLMIINAQKDQDYSKSSFENLIKYGIELFSPLYEECIGNMSFDIIKSCYIRLFGDHNNLVINLEIDKQNWINANVPDNAIAVRVHFGLLPMCAAMYSIVNLRINHPTNRLRRYLHGIVLDNDPLDVIRKETKLRIDHKIFIEAFYPDGSKNIIGNVIDSYIISCGILYNCI